ncbi:MAG: transposase [Hyphomicrobiaceae bacterium]
MPDLMLAFNKAVIELAMGAEMNLYLGYLPARPSRPSRSTSATAAPARPCSPSAGRSESRCRDRHGSFEPILIPKHERRFRHFNERIITMYARCMSLREI